MSKFSIYSKSWIDLVFENKNQNYGAFQLRQKSDETTLLALCLGITVVAMLLTIPILIGSFKTNANADAAPTYDNLVLQLSDFQPTPPETPKKLALPVTKKESEPETKKENLENLEIVKQKEATVENTGTTTANVKSNTDNGASNNTEGTAINGESEKGKSALSSETTSEVLNTTITVDKLPEFPGGLDAFYEYVGKKFVAYDVETTITVYLSFIIEKDGSMTDIKVVRSATPSIDREAIRVLKSLRTKWKPGLKDGQNVRTLYRLPIKVKKQ